MTVYPEISAFIIERGITQDIGYTNSSLLFIATAVAGLMGCIYLMSGKERILTHIDGDKEFPSQQDTTDHNIHDYDHLVQDMGTGRPATESTLSTQK